MTDRSARARVKRWVPRIAPIVLGLPAVIYFGPKFIYAMSHESTDDAYLNVTIVPVSPQVSGTVVRLPVAEHQLVAKGDTLLVIDSTDASNAVVERRAAFAAAHARAREVEAQLEEAQRALAAARADLGAARAQAELSHKERDRYGELLPTGGISPSQLDHKVAEWQLDSARAVAAEANVNKAEATVERLRTDVDVQRATIDESRAQLAAAQVALGRTVVTAPVRAAIAKSRVAVGQFVHAGDPIFSLVRQDSVYVDAKFKETQIAQIRVGQPVEIDIDAYPDVRFHGHVGSFQPGAEAAFSLLPPENATGNFVKVVRRLPVRIWIDGPLDAAHPLWPGLSAVPHVETNAPGHRDTTRGSTPSSPRRSDPR